MKTITNYITEKANFIVKKHVKPTANHNYKVVHSVKEITRNSYAKVLDKDTDTVILAYFMQDYDTIYESVGLYWSCILEVAVNNKNVKQYNVVTSCRFSKEGNYEFYDLDNEDCAIIEYLTKNKPSKDTNIAGKF